MPRIEINNKELMDIIAQRICSANDAATTLNERFDLESDTTDTEGIDNLIEQLDNAQALLGELKESIQTQQDNKT